MPFSAASTGEPAEAAMLTPSLRVPSGLSPEAAQDLAAAQGPGEPSPESDGRLGLARLADELDLLGRHRRGRRHRDVAGDADLLARAHAVGIETWVRGHHVAEPEPVAGGDRRQGVAGADLVGGRTLPARGRGALAP
jgi:hypothetical protein